MDFNINKVKIFVTLPKENLEDIRKAMCDAGAGIIGNYTYCTTSTKTVGTFKPNENKKKVSNAFDNLMKSETINNIIKYEIAY